MHGEKGFARLFRSEKVPALTSDRGRQKNPAQMAEFHP